MSIQATPNTEQILGDSDRSIILPQGAPSLYYVTQTVINYNKDRTGCIQEIQIEGIFVYRTDTINAARKLLDPLDYAEYDKPEKMKEEWPYGDDVVVHAVAETGENTTIEVKAVVDTHYNYEKVV
ncbi:hypothetical protein FAVG1_08606 [Fusarium avenaceum]|nr:hypothetical protein FAVG1_08606 [Fusarium avenaceum]